ncbi:hypothetical protein ACIQRW_20590 [Streptomyces sp. NPDC091287]|uniref:hypothetical protein n=1 Tax=Streptomyces sp. NPDC091287 TaxID=3365988 RepID=UPI00382338B7
MPATTASSQAAGAVRLSAELAACCPATPGHPATVASGEAMATGSGRHKPFTHRYIFEEFPMRAFRSPTRRPSPAVLAATGREGFSWG